jgi:C4-dicarboxylate transporter DctM subunit
VTEVVIMMGGFLLILFLGIPIGVAMGITGVLTILVTGSTTAFFQAIAQKMYTGIDSFALMAIPFFLLAGNLMDRGGISRRLIGFFKLLLRRVPATTAIITSVSSAFFGALTGSAPATVAAIGGITIPIMEKEGYKKGDATAIAAASGILGPIIPPSITMITYGVCASVSVSTMFLAGLIPGILITVGYITVELIRYGRLERGHKEKLPRGAVWDSFKKALLALGMPLIILGGIYGGFFTPTEAAVVSCFYALIVSGVVYKEIRWKDLPGILYTSAKSTAMILFILCMASGYAWLILGCFIDATSIIIICTPILLPVAASSGMHYVALGLMMVVNVACGAITPPLAPNLYVAANVGHSRSIGATSKAVMPLLGAAVFVLMLLTYLPDVILWLPRILGASL